MQDLWDGKSTSNDAQIIQQQLKRVLIKTELKTAEIFPPKVNYNGIYNVQKAVCCTHCYKYN